MRLPLAFATFALVVLPGCLSVPEAVPATGLVPDPEVTPPFAFDLVAEGCNEAGGVSLNPDWFGSDFMAPWEPADTSAYTGSPVPAGTLGIYHSAHECEMLSVDGRLTHASSGGFVGMLVEHPEFTGVEAAPLNLLVATFVTREGTVERALEEAGWYVYEGLGHVDGGWSFGGTWQVRSVLATAGDGVYENVLLLKEEGTPEAVMRLWFIVQSGDGILHPAYLDLAQEGGKRWIGDGYFSHTANGDHPGGAAAATVGGLGFTEVTRRSSGLVVLEDVELEHMFDH